MLFSAVTFASFAACAFAAPHPVRHVLHEKRTDHGPVSGWAKRDAVPAGTNMPVRIGMTQRNLDIGHDLLMEVADPKSAKYGKFYTAEEVHDIFAPHPDTVNALMEWLHDSGIHHASQSYNKQWLQFDVPVETLESLLNTKYHDFLHLETGDSHPACDEYHVPAHLQEHVDYITPGVKLATDKSGRGIKKRSKVVKEVWEPIIESKPKADLLKLAVDRPLSVCDILITPQCIMAMYNITNGTTAYPTNQLGIYESHYESYAQSDMNLYLNALTPWIPQGTGPLRKGIDGGFLLYPGSTKYTGIETMLDFESSIPLIYPQKTVLFQTDDSYQYDYQGFLNTFFDGIDGSYCTYSAFNQTGNSPIDPVYPNNFTGGFNHSLQCGVWKPTNVISISYGGAEYFLPTNYQQRQCSEILKLGLQGVTVVASSGDSGVDSRGFCIGGGYYGDYDGAAFAPNFPTNCPYVLGVGSTYLPVGKSAVSDAEIATTQFPSGGGFSNVYAQPSYQKSAVQTFFNRAKLNYTYYEQTGNATSVGDGLYNRIGRAYPDVAAVGFNFLQWTDGEELIDGGTSLSSPVFASILTRINEARLIAGKSTIGFAHPALYANPSMFHDITVGKNPGCGTKGFPAVKGWDPVTGLGTPNMGKMMDYFMRLP